MRRHYEILSEEARTRLKQRLKDLEGVVGYAYHPAPQLRDHVIELDRQYMEKRDALLHLFESVKISLDDFCTRFRTEVVPLFQESDQKYRGMVALMQFFEDPRI